MEVVANNLCIGCGLCAAVCPHKNLWMEFNEYGEYVACHRGSACPDKCRLCLSVCPFSDEAQNEDMLGEKLFARLADIKHTLETGYYLEAFVGYSATDDHRERGASGGMATWMLERLLKENLVDYVACVSPTNDANRLFEFTMCNLPEQVCACSRSCYYPVEMSGVIEHVLSNDGRYAIIALPCMCKGIRLAMQLNARLQDRIRFVLGLACGQTKSKFFAEYLCTCAGGQIEALSRIDFRVKDPNRPASDYGMKFVFAGRGDFTGECTIFSSEGIGRIWNDRYFTPNPCNFCDDVFAELADVCFMDAWLPAYSRDWRGHSIVLVRSEEVRDMVNKAIKDGSVSLDTMDIAQVVKSQLGVVHSKRRDISERIRLAEQEGRVVPRKRLSLCGSVLSLGRKRLVSAQYVVSKTSGEQWVAANKDLPDFLERMKPHVRRLRRARVIRNVECVPKGVMRRLRKALRWVK
jgi:coenzyme F420 hydrogenase subunit beta